MAKKIHRDDKSAQETAAACDSSLHAYRAVGSKRGKRATAD